MTKKFIASIGYVDYAVELDDAATLLAIAGRAAVVKQKNYTGPYVVQPGSECLVDSLKLAEVVEPEENEKPDVFTAATREVSPF